MTLAQNLKRADFKEGIEKISDLKESMILEGTVTNVTNFGAFVDVGVHQDGLVHISALSNEFVSDPRTVVKAGQIVKVKVMEVDVQRKRIGLSMRLSDEPNQEDKSSNKSNRSNHKQGRQPVKQQSAKPSGAFAAAFAQAKSKK